MKKTDTTTTWYQTPIYKVQLVRDSSVKRSSKAITCDTDVVPIFRGIFEGADREMLAVGLLDTRNQLIGINIVSVGSLNASVVHPREVFKPAILSNAAGIVLVHNHPSGNPDPSPEDCAITKILVSAGRILGIKVLDHVILGDDDTSYSFVVSGKMDQIREEVGA